jgi:hypothetical protein
MKGGFDASYEDRYYRKIWRSRRCAAIPSVLCVVGSIFFSSGCDRLSGCSSARDAKDSFSKQLGSVTESLSTSVPAFATDEVKKLFKVEYKVVKIEGGVTTQSLQKTLSELGDDRWECVLHETMVDDSPHLVCKRLPVGYLKLLMQFIF